MAAPAAIKRRRGITILASLDLRTGEQHIRRSLSQLD